MKKTLLLFVGFFIAAIGFAQDLRPADLVATAKHQKNKTTLPLMQKVEQPNAQIKTDLQNYAEFALDNKAMKAILEKDNSFIEFKVPINQYETLTLELVEVDLYQGNSHVFTEPGMKMEQVDIGKHYRGVVQGDENSFASFSFFDGEISGMIAGYKESNLVIGKQENSNNHIVYSDDQLQGQFDTSCGTPDDGVNYTIEEVEYNDDQTAALTDCVRLYIEVDYDIYQDKGSTQNVTNFVTGIMNQVSTVYANENINTSLSPLVIWTSSSPYSSSQSSGMLSDFQNYRNSFDGDLGQLLSYQASGGIAAGFAGLCASNTDDKQSFSSIDSSYSAYPAYSYTVFVISHEFGHTFGSRHTHACVWNGNGTAIDSCAGYVEGNCSEPGNPAGGGTIMSYCANTSVGIDMTKGFGTQPGNVIRNRVSNASCLQACGSDPDPEPDPDPTPTDCVDGDITLTIKLDNYPEETSWTVKNSSGATVESGGTYGNQADGSTVTVNLTLDAGEYTFTINDSYGDGICCSYGSGNYSLASSDGTTIASGGNFSSSEATSFCVEEGGADTQAPSTPTNLSVTGTTETTVNLDWNDATDNVGVTGYNVYVNSSSIGQVSGSNAEITGLTSNTTYSFYVTAVDAAENESSASNTVSATTDGGNDPAPLDYCDSQGSNSNYEWIDLVELNNMSNPSGNDGGYADNTDKVANLPYGGNTLYVSAGFSGSSYREYWSIWIDYNQDGTFSSSEEVVSGSSSSSARLSANFTVPTSALAGNTTMRVQMKYRSDGNPCETFSYGEVEDYTVTIGASYQGSGFARGGKALEDSNASALDVYPNPVYNGTATMSVADFDQGTYSVIDSYGKVVKQNRFNSGREQIDVSGLAKGVYILKVSNGQRDLTKKIVVQ